ncbi:hypothetical protein HELRODRAFT_162606 [Helobdella robusta]|uniref:Uncharacterized protein n=1 Tax=Helobdella robusta TaxID=6412 RepID=T1ESX3_HELRO|nr:hypothetical protein HELRODRAFT_162606 [Helobdella robusta]ESN99115.1 hypothetical protein HELRODRAFT_162606 [Helobdella robusta]
MNTDEQSIEETHRIVRPDQIRTYLGPGLLKAMELFKINHTRKVLMESHLKGKCDQCDNVETLSTDSDYILKLLIILGDGDVTDASDAVPLVRHLQNNKVFVYGINIGLIGFHNIFPSIVNKPVKSFYSVIFYTDKLDSARSSWQSSNAKLIYELMVKFKAMPEVGFNKILQHSSMFPPSFMFPLFHR